MNKDNIGLFLVCFVLLAIVTVGGVYKVKQAAAKSQVVMVD